jgi:hypothetical protein
MRAPSIAAALAASVAIFGLTACLSDDKGPEEELLDDGKADSQRSPTDHGEIPFETKVNAVLTDTERYHAWQFELSGDAEIELVTSYTVLGQRKTDTVLYLYRETPTSPTGWGPYIARNDDYDGKVYSKITKQLGAGRYRALVKGYSTTTKGKFSLVAHCDGPGCVPVSAPNECLFGSTYGDIPGVGAIVVSTSSELTAADIPNLPPLERERIIAAVHQSSHTDVVTIEEAFAAVDQGEINRLSIYEPAAARTFAAYEYGAGDNSYGGIFEGLSAVLVASIHDGDLLGCAVETETCRLGTSWFEMRSNPDFTRTENRVITSPSQVDELEAEQILAAVSQSTYEVTTIAEALEAVDENRINLMTYFYNGSNTDLTVVEFGAGDNSYGEVFYWRSMQRAAAIQDGDFYGCTLYAPKGGHELGDACRGQGDCVTGLLCTGVFAGAGECVNTADVPGEGVACSSDAACGSPALVCAGVTRGGGYCAPAWQRGTYAASGGALVDNGTAKHRVVVRGLATVDTDVILSARISHPRASQLRVTLVNPATAEVLVHDGVAADDGHDLVIDEPVFFSGDEGVNGEWTLKIVDRATGQTGTLSAWTLTVTSRWD